MGCCPCGRGCGRCVTGPAPAPRSRLPFAGDAQQLYGLAEDAAATTFAADTQVIDAIEEQAGTDGGLLIVLDDLHLDDRPTLRLLDRLAAEVFRLPLLIIGTTTGPVRSLGTGREQASRAAPCRGRCDPRTPHALRGPITSGDGGLFLVASGSR